MTNTIRFEFRCSYQQESHYQVHGAGEAPYEITFNRRPVGDRTYEYCCSRKGAAYDREYGPLSGKVYRHCGVLSQRVYDAFLQHLTEAHRLDIIEITRYWAREPGPKVFDASTVPLVLPTGCVFYDDTAATWKPVEWEQIAA